MGCLEVLLESVMSVSVEGKSKHGGNAALLKTPQNNPIP